MNIRWIFPVAMAVAAGACTSLDIYPHDGDVITGTQNPVPVTVRLDWPNDGRGFGPLVEVDGTSVPPASLTYSRAGATTTVYLRPGIHTLRARTAQFCSICVGGVGQFDMTRTFLVIATVPAVSLTFTPTLVAKGSDDQ